MKTLENSCTDARFFCFLLGRVPDNIGARGKWHCLDQSGVKEKKHMTYATYADLARPAIKRTALLYDIALVMGGSLALALASQIAFKIGPVPVTAQTLAVVLIGAALGSKRGALAIMAYIAEGAMGLPVFSHGGANIPFTFGYIVGFIPAAYLVGLLAERGWDRHMLRSLFMMTLGHAVIFAFGLAWLHFVLQKGLAVTLTAGLYPFIAGTAFKVCLATALLPAAWKFLGRRP
jgi:biotin transport system substrate-specific component